MKQRSKCNVSYLLYFSYNLLTCSQYTTCILANAINMYLNSDSFCNCNLSKSCCILIDMYLNSCFKVILACSN